MAVTVTHPFVSPVADAGDPNEVGPNEWNADHTITGLGTAAEADSADFATAAQGALADTALQSVVQGTGITIDATDPQNPIINATGGGTGDMTAAVYDPQNIADDAFDRANHTGTQLAASISDFSTTADARVAAAVGVSVQAWDAQLDSLSTASANGVSLVQAANYGAMKVLLDLEIGIDVQAYDADLTTWAGLTPSANAQSLVTAADYSAMRTLLGLVIGTNVQAYDADLTTWAGLTPSANAQSLVTAATYAAMRALLDLEAGTDFYSIAAADAAFQPKDADLTSWAGVTRASGFDTFAATPSSANLKTLVTDETGSGALMFATSPSITTDITIPNTGLHLLDTDASHDLIVKPGSNLTADRTLTITTGDTAIEIDLTDPGADRLMFWDDSASKWIPLTLGTNLTITGTTIDAAGGASMTLLGTLTTNSGTTQPLTGIAAGYREIYCELDGVSFTASAALTVALSSTNGGAYGTAATVSVVSGSAGGTLSGSLRIANVSSAVAATKSVAAILATAAGAATAFSALLATNTAAVVDAIQFAGGTFDAGTIRIYGVK